MMKRQHIEHADSENMGFVFPIIVMFLILCPYFFVVPYVILPVFGWSVAGIVNIGIASTFIAMILINYYKSLMTPPGSPPPGWTPDEEEATEDLDAYKASKRFCQKCNAHKPPRSHHCRICNKCIMKMDHHCPWINNCVGHDNHKFFLLFLVYAVGGIFYALLMVVVSFIDALTSRGIEDFVVIFGHTITATIMFPVGLAIFMLLTWQMWLVVNNTTSIEYEEYERLKRTYRKEGKTLKYVNKYDVGLMGNLRNVFGGGSIVWWLLPYAPYADTVNFKRDYRSYVSKV